MIIEREPFIHTFSKNVRVLPFEDVTGAIKCWSMGRQSAEEFCKSQGINMSFPVFAMETRRFTTVKLFFPVRNSFYLSTLTKIHGAPTLINILKAIETFAQLAIDIGYGIVGASPPSGTATENAAVDVPKILRGLQCCHLVISRSGGHNKVYVRLTH
jgi:hypothetical protein